MYNKPLKTTKLVLMPKKLKLFQTANQIQQDYIIHKFYLKNKNISFFKSEFYYFFTLIIKQINFIRHLKYVKFKYQLIFIILLTLFYVSCNCDPVDWSQIPTPPSFIHKQNPLIIYFSIDFNNNENNYPGDGVVNPNFHDKMIRCAAIGNPKPLYNWLKDNVPLPLHMFRDRIIQSKENGSLIFTHFTEIDEGLYQCTASNDNGTAFSEFISLRQAWIRPFGEYDPELVFVELGDPYSRKCVSPESSPPAYVFWLFRSPKDNQFLQAINSSHISSNEKGTIFFHNVQETDFKENRFYACAAYNSELMEYKFSNQFNFVIGKKKRDKLNPIIPVSEQYVNQSSPIALVGQIHKLHCFFSGYPDPYPNWYHNGVEITQNNTKGFTFESYGKTLVFNVTTDHLGKYECKFQTHTSAIDRVFNVKVDAAPYWHDLPPAHTNTSEGETVVFDCKTSGNPTPVVTFYKNGVEMKRPKQGENWIIDGSKLTIYDVKKGINGEGDNAVYQCKSENKHGYLWTNFFLNLLAFQPKLLETEEKVEAIEGKPFTMSCKFFASPLANVTWESPVLHGSDYRSTVDQFGVEVKHSYEGEYKCIGTNKYGSAIGIIKLFVRKPTTLKSFDEPKKKKQAGLPLRLECKAENDPNLSIKYEWIVNDKLLDIQKQVKDIPIYDGDLEHYIIDKDNSLIINNPTQHDTGIYVCKASTKLDSISKEVFISIEDVSVPVYSAYIYKCDNQRNSATIHFEHLEPATETVPVKEFWVRYIADLEEDTGRWKTHPASIRAIDYEAISNGERRVKASITIPLHPFGTYIFQIIARNAIGDSSPLQVKGECITNQKAPTQNPSNVRVEGSQPDNLIVYWNAMPREEWNGEKFAYEILYKPKFDNGEWKSIKVDDPFAEKLTIDLNERQPWELYEVQVKAKNILGDSLVTPEIIEGRTGEGDPGVTPNNFRVTDITSSSAKFIWDPVDSSKVQGNFTSYKISYWFDEKEHFDDNKIDKNFQNSRKKRSLSYKKNNNKIHQRIRKNTNSNFDLALYRKSIFIAPNVSYAIISNLQPNSLNYATVSVVNGQNEGIPSDIVSFRTQEGVPTSVRNIKAYPMNYNDSSEKGVVNIKWLLPRNTNGKLTHFGVTKCRTKDLEDEIIFCDKEEIIPITITHLRFKKLEFDSTYRFKVSAYTKSGQGQPNSADVRTLPDALLLNVEPVRPSLEVEEIGNNFFNVSYVPGIFDSDKQLPIGNTFYFKYRENEDDDWQFKYPENDNLSVHIDKLESGTKHQVSVVSVYKDINGQTTENESQITEITTSGVSPRRAKIYWFLLILLILLILLMLLCIIILFARNRKLKYPVAEKERLHGRESAPIKDKKFDEYGKIEDEEKNPLTNHNKVGEPEIDSMAEFGEGDPGRFTEDGSFIGQYGPNKTLFVTTTTTKSNGTDLQN